MLKDDNTEVEISESIDYGNDDIRRFGDMDYNKEESEMKEHGYSGVDENDEGFELLEDNPEDSYDDDYDDYEE